MASTEANAANDVDDLRACAHGDTVAVSRLYRRHARAVYRFAWLCSGDDGAAADIVQDTFLALLDGPAGGRGFDPARGSVAAYLCGIARHLAQRRWRDRHVATEDIDGVIDAQADGGDLSVPPLPQDALERARAVQSLHAGIRALPSYYREVLVLVELQEMSYADAAHVTGVELGTVRSRLARAKRQLATWLAQRAADPSTTSGTLSGDSNDC